MAALDLTRRIARRRGGLVGIGISVAAALCACSASAPEPEALPAQTATRHRPEAPAVAPTPTPTPAPTPPPTTIVIEPGEALAPAAPSLAEAARRERERRAATAAPAVKLDNKNLEQFAAGQKLTVANPATDENAPAGEDAGDEPRAGDAQDEAYWREGARAIRERWAHAVEDIARLEEESAGLRQQFYAADDPYVRDQQIKPEWDRVLNALDRARREASKAPDDLDAFLEAGRHAGALPGWLREGIELEPEVADRERSSLGPAEPREPVVVEKEPDNP